MTMVEGFTGRALDAATSALSSIAVGSPFQVDDLVAGALAIELMGKSGELPPAQALDVQRRLRVLVNGFSLARSAEGRAEASQLIPMVLALRGDK